MIARVLIKLTVNRATSSVEFRFAVGPLDDAPPKQDVNQTQPTSFLTGEYYDVSANKTLVNYLH